MKEKAKTVFILLYMIISVCGTALADMDQHFCYGIADDYGVYVHNPDDNHAEYIWFWTEWARTAIMGDLTASGTNVIGLPEGGIPYGRYPLECSLGGEPWSASPIKTPAPTGEPTGEPTGQPEDSTYLYYSSCPENGALVDALMDLAMGAKSRTPFVASIGKGDTYCSSQREASGCTGGAPITTCKKAENGKVSATIPLFDSSITYAKRTSGGQISVLPTNTWSELKYPVSEGNDLVMVFAVYYFQMTEISGQGALDFETSTLSTILPKSVLESEKNGYFSGAKNGIIAGNCVSRAAELSTDPVYKLKGNQATATCEGAYLLVYDTSGNLLLDDSWYSGTAPKVLNLVNQITW